MADHQGDAASKTFTFNAPAATALAAIASLVGAVVGALINGYFNNRTSVELEQLKFETGLIVKALETSEQPLAVKTLKFYANAGLITHYEKRISTLVQKENDLEIPAIGSFAQQVLAPQITSFAYVTSPVEIEPGRREWQRVDADHWTEAYPVSKKISRFVVKTRINLNGCGGSVVANENEPDFQVFIPDKGCQAMFLWFRRGEQQNWVRLAPMIDIT